MSDDDTKKKKFNPYLTPTESEDEPKLVDEEALEEKHLEDEEYDDPVSTEEEGEITVAESPDEEVTVEEEEEIVDEAVTSEEKLATAASARPRSWSYHAAALLFLLLFGDVVIQRLGVQFFWTPRAVYILSYVVRTTALLIAAYLWHRSLFRDNRKDMQIVFLWLGLISGCILALLRFIGAPSFWSFINMVVEPLDSMLLALFAAFVVGHLAIRLQVTKKTI